MIVILDQSLLINNMRLLLVYDDLHPQDPDNGTLK